MSSNETPSLAASFRMLADLLEEQPVLEQWFRFSPGFAVHQFKDGAGRLDTFADMFGVTVQHQVHGANSGEPGARYSAVETAVGGINLRMQAHTEDYEKASGKTIDNAAVSS